MTDRLRAERIEGRNVVYDRSVGYSRPVDLREAAALAAELVALIELDVTCEGQTPRLTGRPSSG